MAQYMMEGLHSKFEKIWRNFCHFENFVLKTGFLAQHVACRRARLILGHLLEENFTFLGLAW